MRRVKAKCGHMVEVYLSCGDAAIKDAERRVCDRARCVSGLPRKFTEQECEAYVWLLDIGTRGWWVDLKDRSVGHVNGERFASITEFAQSRGWRV